MRQRTRFLCHKNQSFSRIRMERHGLRVSRSILTWNLPWVMVKLWYRRNMEDSMWDRQVASIWGYSLACGIKKQRQYSLITHLTRCCASNRTKTISCKNSCTKGQINNQTNQNKSWKSYWESAQEKLTALRRNKWIHILETIRRTYCLNHMR